MAVRPLAQKSCQLCGLCLSAEILRTWLSSTVTSKPQEAKQYLQKVCTVREDGVAAMPPWCPSTGRVSVKYE
ncbi:hypothetical protein MTER_41420 [Mycolicibacter terrae]|uniref:Uncharacterized protein n=1 Tax=Mycolicibacter terrae TaxID=1788 RepID=A0AAD1MJD2_9MYCO|nr:hypothetical protein MTER_41420 [Mycolicibacter terrae]